MTVLQQSVVAAATFLMYTDLDGCSQFLLLSLLKERPFEIDSLAAKKERDRGRAFIGGEKAVGFGEFEGGRMQINQIKKPFFLGPTT